jgi:hypothetical protein
MVEGVPSDIAGAAGKSAEAYERRLTTTGSQVGQSAADMVEADERMALDAGSITSGWQPGPAELELAARQPRIPPEQFSRTGSGVNETYVGTYDRGRAVFKPESGVDSVWREALGGALLYPRELATYSTDQMLGFNLVPTTALAAFHTPRAPGIGSLQEWVPSAETNKSPEDFEPVDQQRMAVLDYVTANGDRNHNYLTGIDGRPVAIDHGGTFPPRDVGDIASRFVAAWQGRQLSPEVLGQVRAVDPGAFQQMLLARGIDMQAAEGAVARLKEIQVNGMITGGAFSGLIERFVPAGAGPG